MRTYYPTIGLEIHAELKTATKMFCNSANDPEERRPNVNVCPICMGHPGTLPTVNREAVLHVLRVGVALGGEIARYSEFDRKNYFYPDIPKGYQISQYEFPLVKGGSLRSVALTRVHLEEDTARSSHWDEGGKSFSLVDFNRAGVPLMELVTEPVIESAEQAVLFARELQLLLRYLGAGDANMEKGEMRVEANISISAEKGRFGKKVEVKNLNSFRAVEHAITYEFKRQQEILEMGEEVIQETRGWSEERSETYPQRRKEESHDYRYFPDPDIPKLLLSEIPEFSMKALKGSLPELPWKKRERLLRFGLKTDEAELYVGNVTLGKFFEVVGACLQKPELIRLASNYIASDLLGLIKARNTENAEISIHLKPEDFSELMIMVFGEEVSSRAAKDILKVMYDREGDPRTIAKEEHLFQQSDPALLTAAVERVLLANAKVVTDFRAGKQGALQYLIGQCMKETKGSANPGVLKDLILKLLG